METYIPLILTGLFSSGGVVALVAVLAEHKTKQKAIELEKIKLEMDNPLSGKRKRVPLEYHPIFTALDELEFFFMFTFKYSDMGRTLIVREMCVHKIRVWRDILKKYAVDAQECCNSCENLKGIECNKAQNLISAMLLEGVREYNNLYSSVGLKMVDVTGSTLYDQASLDTMKVFIPIFNAWHDPRVEAVKMASHDIPISGLNADCYEDYWDVFMVYLYAFIQMKYDAIGAIKQLNGQLTGREFLGVIVGEV